MYKQLITIVLSFLLCGVTRVTTTPKTIQREKLNVILLFDHLPTEPPPPDDDPVPTTPPPRGDHLPTEPPMPYHSVELNMFYPKPASTVDQNTNQPLKMAEEKISLDGAPKTVEPEKLNVGPPGGHHPTEPPMPQHRMEINFFYPKPASKSVNFPPKIDENTNQLLKMTEGKSGLEDPKTIEEERVNLVRQQGGHLPTEPPMPGMKIRFFYPKQAQQLEKSIILSLLFPIEENNDV